jgi:hypothetical protein
VLDNPPALAGITETWFDAAVARIIEIKASVEQRAANDETD